MQSFGRTSSLLITIFTLVISQISYAEEENYSDPNNSLSTAQMVGIGVGGAAVIGTAAFLLPSSSSHQHNNIPPGPTPPPPSSGKLEFTSLPVVNSQMPVGENQILLYSLKNNSSKDLQLIFNGFFSSVFRDHNIPNDCLTLLGTGKACQVKLIAHPANSTPFFPNSNKVKNHKIKTTIATINQHLSIVDSSGTAAISSPIKIAVENSTSPLIVFEPPINDMSVGKVQILDYVLYNQETSDLNIPLIDGFDNITIKRDESVPCNCASHLPGLGKCTVRLKVTPTTEGPVSQILNIGDTQTSYFSRPIALYANGISVVDDQSTPVTYAFSNEAPDDGKITIKNMSVNTVNLQTIVNPTSDANITILNEDECNNVAPNSSCTFRFQYAAKSLMPKKN